ncbi:hypothetical protein Trydic_g12460 [Trypoxylus dichotomus]
MKAFKSNDFNFFPSDSNHKHRALTKEARLPHDKEDVSVAYRRLKREARKLAESAMYAAESSSTGILSGDTKRLKSGRESLVHSSLGVKARSAGHRKSKSRRWSSRSLSGNFTSV